MSREGGRCQDGPAVQLGSASSIFPRQLARAWRARGLASVLVTRAHEGVGVEEDDLPIVPAAAPGVAARAVRRVCRPALVPLERLAARLGRRHYRRSTGYQAPSPWEWRFLDTMWETPGLVRAALAQRPRFVFGHEVTAYGPATARCRGVPRILFPWGGDVYNYAETSLVQFAVVRRALHGVDLVLPSSTAAAAHIVERYGVPGDKVRAVSWGVDLELFRPLRGDDRERARCALGARQDSIVVVNPRRFSRRWSCFEVLDAFLALAGARSDVCCVMLGGGTEADIGEGRRSIEDAGLTSRVRIIEGTVDLGEFARIVGAADVFVSWMGRGDMRSASVLQAAAAGGAPIIARQPEYVHMEAEGFAAELVPFGDGASLLHALGAVCDDPVRRARMVAANRRYLERHEDASVQMDRLLATIEEVVGNVNRREPAR